MPKLPKILTINQEETVYIPFTQGFYETPKERVYKGIFYIAKPKIKIACANTREVLWYEYKFGITKNIKERLKGYAFDSHYGFQMEILDAWSTTVYKDMEYAIKNESFIHPLGEDWHRCGGGQKGAEWFPPERYENLKKYIFWFLDPSSWTDVKDKKGNIIKLAEIDGLGNNSRWRERLGNSKKII